MKIVSDSCIENYPDANVPTLFVYKGGAVAGSVVGLGPLGGTKVTDDSACMALGVHLCCLLAWRGPGNVEPRPLP